MQKRFLAVMTLLLLLSLGCGLSGAWVTPTPIFPTKAILPPTNTAPATVAAPTQAEATPQRASPTATRRPPATSAPLPAPAEGNMHLKIFMVAVDDNGASGKKIGCNDSIIPVTVEVPYTQGVLRAALTRLLSQKERDYGESGLVNALYQSNLSIDTLAIQNGEAIIRLSGTLTSGGTCDDPRIIAQLEETALQFSTVERVSIYVNGTKIQQLLSRQG